ncbi:predicted protein [Naegleria gruberi]|uniref:Predicted protein n=1 Tax=Naegleria gruberi TaxID=5762 RepID=D2VIW6_NAEGR|nr:uncharacterized protein NAEGRDRAFT_68824 [Naegleria gruberi]EFC43097.1 predicted protein [Naegleria gruberi]|eukprot:XP_002675841.1 predicted protein [Naegleria gruberi strain NEG-M]
MSNNPLQGLVYRATDSKNPTDDWDSIMQLSDLLCQNPDENTKLILPLLNGRLRDTNSATVLYSLTLADALMKNTSDFVKQQFLRSDFLTIINNLSTRSSDQQVRQKATEVMNENQIPQASQTIQQQSPPVSQPRTVPQPMPVSQPLSTNTKRSTTRKLATYQEKMDNDLNVVRENVALLNELVTASSSPGELRQDDTAAQLRANCEEMSRRIIGLIEMIPEEQVLLKLLEVHENLNNSTQRYDKFMTSGQKEAVKLASPTTGNNSSAPPLSPQVSQGFGALANRNNQPNVNRNPPTKPNNGALSLDDFLGTNSTPIQPQSNPTPVVNPNVNSNQRTPLSLDDFLGLPVQPSQPQPSIPQNSYAQQQPTHYNPNQQQQFNNPPPSYEYSNNPYADTMEREFSRLNAPQQQPQQPNNNTMYPNVGYNPYSSSSDQIDPNDPFGVSKQQSQPQEGGFAALAHRKKN